MFSPWVVCVTSFHKYGMGKQAAQAFNLTLSRGKIHREWGSCLLVCWLFFWLELVELSIVRNCPASQLHDFRVGRKSRPVSTMESGSHSAGWEWEILVDFAENVYILDL